MMRTHSSPIHRLLLGVATLFCAVLVASQAFAMGAFRLRSNEIQESGSSWHIYLSLDLPSPPAIAHVPMKFMFTKLTVYERAQVDNQKEPVLNRVPIQNAMPAIESLDVDFADGSGKIFKTTRYDFSLTRTRGFEAGEYKMQVRTSDGSDVGSSVTIILKGDNPVVDRRSISFEARPKAKEDAGKVASNDTSGVPTSTDVAAVGTAPPFVPKEGFEKTDEEEIKTKPGGCGCSIPGLSGSSQAAFAFGSVFAFVVLARRRSARRS